MCDHSNESHEVVLSCVIVSMDEILNARTFKEKEGRRTILWFCVWQLHIRRILSYGTVSNFWLRGWNPKRVTIQLKPTKASPHTVLFQNCNALNEILNVSPEKWKLHRPIFLWWGFKLLSLCINPKRLTIPLKAIQWRTLLYIHVGGCGSFSKFWVRG